MKNAKDMLGLVLTLAALSDIAKRREGEQAEAAPSQEEERGTGRTTRHALAAALKALEHPGHSEVKMGDHSNTPEGNLELASKVSAVLTALGVHHVQKGDTIAVSSIGKQDASVRSQDPNMPEWAEGHNPARELQPGAQLLTKDGRRMGNAWALGFDESDGQWCIHTDAGNHVHLNTGEVHEQFYVGEWLCDPSNIEARFTR